MAKIKRAISAHRLENLPDALASRVGRDTGLPSRETLSGYLSKQDLETDFAANLWQPVSHAEDNNPEAPLGDTIS